MIFTVTHEQFIFLHEFHELIQIRVLRSLYYPIPDFLRMIEKLPQFQRLFKVYNYCWDDILDRYEDYPDYSRDIRLAIAKQFSSIQHNPKFIFLQSIRLDDMQYEFLSHYHETVEIIMTDFLFCRKMLIEFVRHPQYQDLFSDMTWDAVYDFYQSHPEYDSSFRDALHQQYTRLT